MSYYNTQNNPQQNPQVQANNRLVTGGGLRDAGSSQGGQAGQQSFNNWMRPQRQSRQPQNKNSQRVDESYKSTPQQNPNGGFQPRSPVNANGTISTNPINFSAGYQPPPAIQSSRSVTNSGTSGPQPDPLWAKLRAEQTSNPGTIRPEHQQVSQAYQQYLGRPGNAVELAGWASNPNFLQGIQNSPEALAWKQQQQNPQSAPQQPNPFGQLPQYNPMQVPDFVDYNSMNYGAINTPNMYDVNRPGAYNYGGQLDENSNPFSQGTQDAFRRMSELPGGLPVEQMKAAQAETAQEMFQQNAATGMQRAAGSGTVNGGMAERQRQQMMDDRNKQILGGYRDIDIENSYALRDNAEKLATTGNTLADSYNRRLATDEDFRYQDAQSNQDADMSYQDYLAQQYQDGLDGSNFELDRLGAQDDSNQFAADYGQETWDTLNNNYFKGRQQNLTDFLGTEGMNLDWAGFDEEKSQNKFGNIMDLLGFTEDQRQFNSQFGLDKSKFKLDSRNSAMSNALKRRDQDINLLDFFGEG
jgi:hypothetical protein